MAPALSEWMERDCTKQTNLKLSLRCKHSVIGCNESLLVGCNNHFQKTFTIKIYNKHLLEGCNKHAT